MSERQSVSVFGIELVADYLHLCEEAVDALAQDQANVLKGFTAVLVLNHFPDWLRYKLSEEDRGVLGLSSTRHGDKVIEDFERQNEDLELVRGLANGLKHLRPINPTFRIEGYGKGPYGVGPHGVPYLLIDLGGEMDPSERWVVGLDLCQKVLRWWVETLRPILPDQAA